MLTVDAPKHGRFCRRSELPHDKSVTQLLATAAGQRFGHGHSAHSDICAVAHTHTPLFLRCFPEVTGSDVRIGK